MVTLPRALTPCFNCNERNATCHSVCDKYKTYKMEQQAQKEIKDKEQKLIRERGEYIRSLKDKQRKRKRK